VRLPGYCRECGAVGRVVLVDTRGMLSIAVGGVAEGTCDSCADELELERERRRRTPGPRRAEPRRRP
jgi:hypothetical protein